MSVLFADLVGFTALSEHRDPEEVRELLGGYFSCCRELIERHGGTVEKFIGDAVMAVWGAPVAREDDAERAVRAGLALPPAIAALGEQNGMPGLAVRAGVLTGTAAVELGAEAQGMVLGDTVNTASRLQSIAAPGTVLVDDVTRRASEAAIAYEDAGTHVVKGRERPVHAWTALRVVAGAGGARRSVGPEPPFVGRDAELQAIIAAGEDSALAGRALLTAVSGEAGAGKSRLLWEFFKYLDGIEEIRWWHQGRCLSYGEGVAYWALAEIVRSRAGILEDEDPEPARAKLTAMVAEHLHDERERRLVEPRLAHLLRLDDRADADRADLFSGWRLFFERLAAVRPVVLVFEDLQWADSGLLDFIDHLLEWSAQLPIYVLALGRPELLARRPSWQGVRLAPLEPSAIAQLLDGVAPGLPEELIVEISSRSEGIPLYAVEMIRMLQDRGLLVQDGARYVVAGDVSDLRVPETLHALIASRLDALSSEERALLQAAAVLGQSFAAPAVAALAGRPEHDTTERLDALVAKQMLGRVDDPRSPERGQYIFLQKLVRTVAYDTLSLRARKVRHVQAARYLEQSWPGEAADVAEVLASHYLAAIRMDPSADDVIELRGLARDRLTAAGRAAASLALGPEARRYFEQAAELVEDELQRAELHEQAGRALWQSGDADAAERSLRTAIELYERAGRRTGGAAAVTLATMFSLAGRLDEARPLLERFRSEELAPGTGEVVRAQALAVLGSVMAAGHAPEEAGPLLEQALTILEEQQAWPELCDALVRRGTYLVINRRDQEGTAILRHALALAEEHDLPAVLLRARNVLAGAALDGDRLEDALAEANSGLSLARERGDRRWERAMLGQQISPLVMLGRWDEALAAADRLVRDHDDIWAMIGGAFLAPVAGARGDEEGLARCRALAERHRDSSNIDLRAAAALVLARDALEREAWAEVLATTRTVLAVPSIAGEFIAEAYGLSVEAALCAEDDAALGELSRFVAGLPPIRYTPLLRAGNARLAAGAEFRRGDVDASERHARQAQSLLEDLGARPLLGWALAESARRRGDPETLERAREIFLALGATRWLERLERVAPVARISGVPA